MNKIYLDYNLVNYNQNYETLKKEGYNINLINIKNAIKSNNFNPLSIPYEKWTKGEKDISIEMVNQITSRIYAEDFLSSDPFWTNTASDLISGLILYLFENIEKEKINLGSVYVLLDNYLLDRIDLLKDIDAINPIYQLLSTTLLAPEETKKSIIAVAKQNLKTYILKPNILALLSTTNIDLNAKYALFINLSDNKELNNIANIIIDQLYFMDKEKVEINLHFIDYINRLDSLKSMIYENKNIEISTNNTERLKEIYEKHLFDNYKFSKFNNLNVNEEKELPTLNTSFEIYNLKDQ